MVKENVLAGLILKIQVRNQDTVKAGSGRAVSAAPAEGSACRHAYVMCAVL